MINSVEDLSVYSLGNNRYYFISEIGERDAEDDENYSYDTFKIYSVMERKNVDGVEFWSWVKSSDKEISIEELYG